MVLHVYLSKLYSNSYGLFLKMLQKAHKHTTHRRKKTVDSSVKDEFTLMYIRRTNAAGGSEGNIENKNLRI